MSHMEYEGVNFVLTYHQLEDRESSSESENIELGRLLQRRAAIP